MRKIMYSLGAALLMSSQAMAAGSHDHSHDAHASHGKQGHDAAEHHNMADMFLLERQVDGYQVSFHVMPAVAGMEHGGPHNLMIKIAEGDKVLSDVKINSKVIHPDGREESKPLMRMGDWYMNGYDLGHAGEHQLMILFKTANGSKHKAGVYYPQR